MTEKIRTDWIINGLLTVILTLLIGNYVLNNSSNFAHAAGEGGGWATDGVMIGATATPNDRLILVDTKKQNIMIYHYRSSGGLGLSGVRCYKYDIEIEDTDKQKLGTNGWTYFDAKKYYDDAHK